MKAPRLFLCAVLILAAAAPAQQAPASPPSPPPAPPPQAQQAPSPPPPPPPSCTEPEFRQFDFWVGSWTVLGPNDLPVGLSEVTRVSGGCAILEDWQAVMGGDGMSLNYFDRSDRSWHQMWVGSGGAILHLKGGLQDGKMVMISDDYKTPKGVVRHRYRWTRQPDGIVVQEAESSEDGGKTWQQTFMGRYRKR